MKILKTRKDTFTLQLKGSEDFEAFERIVLIAKDYVNSGDTKFLIKRPSDITKETDIINNIGMMLSIIGDELNYKILKQ